MPNRAALEGIPRHAGFHRVDFLAPAPHHEEQYVRQDRGVVAAHVDGPGPAAPPAAASV